MTKYYAGPWVWDDGSPSPHYRAPAGTVAVVDLRNLPLQSVGQHASGTGHGFFSGPDGLTLPSEYTLLGAGHLRDLQIGGAVRSAWESLYGVRVPGDADHLIDCLSYTLTDGADPEGLSGPKPLVPCVGTPVGECCIHLAGHSVVYSSTVDVIRGQSRHARSLRHMMQRELENLAETDPDPDLWRRVAGYQKKKYGQAWDNEDEDWLLTPKLRAKGKGRNSRTFANEPKTTYTESWPTNGDAASGQNRSWSHCQATDMTVSSGQLTNATAGGTHYSSIKMGTGLSGADMYAQLVYKSRTNGGGSGGGTVRKHATNATLTYYRQWNYYSTIYLDKVITGSPSTLGTAGNTFSADQVFKIEANGSAIKIYKDAVSQVSVTDTAITGNVYAGAENYTESSGLAYTDSWECGDLGGGGGPSRTDLGLLLGVS